MSSSRENSPDWLRCFQAPTRSVLSLSSDSEPLSNTSPSRDDKVDSQSAESESDDDKPISHHMSNSKGKKRGGTEDDTLIEKKKRKTKAKESQGYEVDGQDTEEAADDHVESKAGNHSIWAISSDSESFRDDSSQKKAKGNKVKRSQKGKDTIIPSNVGSPSKKALEEKSPKKVLKVESRTVKEEEEKSKDAPKTGDHDDIEAIDKDVSEKQTGPQVSTSRIPLLLSDKVNRSKALVECEGDFIDLSGDMGAVGRVVIPDTSSGNNEMFLDLKGTIYRTKIIPSRTFCIVSFGQSEAKIEAITNDFIQLEPQSNVYEAETMVEGTLEGFSFDSEDEGDKMPKPNQTDQNEGNEEQTNGKAKAKAKKASGGVQKKGKTGKKSQPTKKARKKAQAPKRGKAKK